MALVWVKVNRNDDAGTGEDVYVGGNYVDPAGQIGKAFRVQTGRNTFETLDASNKPDWRKIVEDLEKPAGNRKTTPVQITLDPIPMDGA